MLFVIILRKPHSKLVMVYQLEHVSIDYPPIWRFFSSAILHTFELLTHTPISRSNRLTSQIWCQICITIFNNECEFYSITITNSITLLFMGQIENICWVFNVQHHLKSLWNQPRFVNLTSLVYSWIRSK